MAELRIWRRSCYYFCERTADLRRRRSHHYILRRRCGLTHLDGGGQPKGGRGWRRTRDHPGGATATGHAHSQGEPRARGITLSKPTHKFTRHLDPHRAAARPARQWVLPWGRAAPGRPGSGCPGLSARCPADHGSGCPRRVEHQIPNERQILHRAAARPARQWVLRWVPRGARPTRQWVSRSLCAMPGRPWQWVSQTG
jgi:hypothetical protein